MTTNFRAALQRSHVRNYVEFMLGEEASQYDTEALINELNASDDRDYRSMTPENFREIAKRHEYDANGVTTAELAKAVQNTVGWVAIVRRPNGDVDQMTLKPGKPGTTAEDIEATLREFVNFPEGTSIMVLPLVG
jgi:hypothetical protein